MKRYMISAFIFFIFHTGIFGYEKGLVKFSDFTFNSVDSSIAKSFKTFLIKRLESSDYIKISGKEDSLSRIDAEISGFVENDALLLSIKKIDTGFVDVSYFNPFYTKMDSIVEYICKTVGIKPEIISVNDSLVTFDVGRSMGIKAMDKYIVYNPENGDSVGTLQIVSTNSMLVKTHIIEGKENIKMGYNAKKMCFHFREIPPKLLNMREIEREVIYPYSSRKDKVQGIVKFKALVGADGEVKDVKLIEGQADKIDFNAGRMVYKMKFAPAKEICDNKIKQIPMWIVVPFNFTLVK